MNSDNKFPNGRSFSNLRNAPLAARVRAQTPAPGLALMELPQGNSNDQRSSDPYNTSGSFDRKKNWSRVGKR